MKAAFVEAIAAAVANGLRALRRTWKMASCDHVWIENGPGEHKCEKCPAWRSDFGL